MDRSKLLISLLLLLAYLPATAEMYQWKDDQGRIHFGDRPPEQIEATQLQQQKGQKQEKALALEIVDEQFSLTPENMARIEALMPQILHIYKNLFGLDLRKQVEVKLSLLKDKRTFDLWLSQHSGEQAPLNISGVYLPKTREVAIWDNGDETQMVGTILHESSHVIMAQLSPWAPSWLQEGLAEYFENIRFQDDFLMVEAGSHAQNNVRQWLNEGSLISLRKYLSIPNSQWRERAHSDDPVPYTIAWATTYFMLSSTTGKSVLRRILQDLEKSQRWPTVNDVDSRYPGGIIRMDFEFYKWAQEDAQPHFYTPKVSTQ